MAETSAAWHKGNEYVWVVEQLVYHGPGSQITTLKIELRHMDRQMRGLEEILDKAFNFMVKLSDYVSKLPTAPGGINLGLVPSEEF